MVDTLQLVKTVVADGNSATMDTGTLTGDLDVLRVVVQIEGGGSGGCRMRFNSDTGNNYRRLFSENGGAKDGHNDGAGNGITNMVGRVDRRSYSINTIYNISGKETSGYGHCITDGGNTGSANAPTRMEYAFKWANTAQITSIQIESYSTAWASGSTLNVYAYSREDTSTSDEKTTLTGGLPIGTRYEEVDTRKIYRSTTVYSSVDSSASSLTDVTFDASTEIGDLTYSGNEITRSSDSYARHGINSEFYFRNSGTQTVECVAQNTGTSSWVTFGLSASKLEDVGINSNAPNQLEYAIRAADDGRTWIRQSSNNWTQVSDTADNTTFKITNNRTTVTYYANGSSIGTTTHGTPASTYYIGAFVSQTGTDGSFVFDYSGDITSGNAAEWKERGTA